MTSQGILRTSAEDQASESLVGGLGQLSGLNSNQTVKSKAPDLFHHSYDISSTSCLVDLASQELGLGSHHLLLLWMQVSYGENFGQWDDIRV